MINKALTVIEETYSIGLNPDLDYGSQLQSLAANGELANRLSSNNVLFKLCMIVDEQAKEIQLLKDDRVAIATKMIEFQDRLEVLTADVIVQPKAVNPSLPLG